MGAEECGIHGVDDQDPHAPNAPDVTVARVTTPRGAGRLIPRSASFIGAVSLAGRVVERLAALGQILLIAAVFGATARADLYFIASIVPITIGGILGEALYVTILPSLARRGRANVADLAGGGFWISAGLLVVATGVYLVAVVLVVTIAKPAGSDSLAPWLAFTPIAFFLGLATYASAVLLHLERYFWPPFRSSTAALVGLALSALALALTDEVVWVALAVTAGYAVAFLLLLLEVLAVGGRSMVRFPTRESMAEVAALRDKVVVSLIGGLLGGQIFVFVERLLAASLGVGAVAAISYSRGIAFTPTVVAQSVVMGLYPGMLRAHADENREYLRGSFLAGLRVTLFLAAGAAAYLALFAESIAEFVFAAGDLSGASILEIEKTLRAFSLALLGTMVLVFTARVFNALDFFRAIAWSQGAALLVYVVLALPLRPALGPSGLALAFGIAELVGAGFALIVASRRIGLDAATIVRRVVRPLGWRIGALAAGLVLTHSILSLVGVERSSVVALAGLAVAAILGIALLWSTPWEELDGARAVVRRLTGRMPA
jgi:putative peptidoglycan lipid II flippase